MSELHESFEGKSKIENTPQPKVDALSILEKGEIISAETLEGFFPIKVVKIKDDGKALFRPDGFVYERLEKREDLRTELELLAYSLDQVLEFGLVPPVISRKLSEDGIKGTFQKFIENAELAANYGTNWPEVVVESEILKAAVFDFLINAQDRHGGNFLVDPDSGKIWLIDHDLHMFVHMFTRGGIPSDILAEAVKRNLTELPEEIIKSIQRLYDRINYLSPTSIDLKVQEILLGIKNRARNLLDDRKIKAEEP